MALSLDGSAHGSSTGSLTATATLTTTQTNDVIIAFVNAIDKGGGVATISSVSGGGLTWTKRQGISGFNVASSAHCVVEEWWAPASAALTSQVITATAAFTASADHISIHVFGVNGCASISSPFDPNVNALATFTHNGSGQSTAVAANVTQVSTTNADNLIASYWFGGFSGNPTNAAGTGMIGIAVDNNGGGTNFDQTTSQYVIKSAVQTNFGTVFTNTNVSQYACLADSLTGDSATATSTIDQTLSGITQEVDITESIPSTITQTLSGITQALSAAQTGVTFIDQTFFGISQDIEVLAGAVGSWASTETADIAAMTGHPSLFGSLGATEAKDVFNGVVADAGFPKFVNAGAITHTAFGTSISPALPGSRVNGNLLIAMVEVDKALTWPGDWTVVDSIVGGNIGAAYAYRVIDGTEVAPAVTWTGNAEALGKVWQFSGVISIGTTDKVGDAGNVATFSNPGIVTTGDNSMVALLWMGNNGTISGTPSGWTAQTSDSNTATIALLTQNVSTRGASSTAISGQALSGSMRSLSFEVELTSVIPPNFAAWASTESKDVWTSHGSLIGGSWHSTEAKDLASMSGFVPLLFSFGLIEAKDIANFAVYEPPFGTLSATEAKDALSFSGAPTPPLGLDAHASGGASGSSSVGVTSATVAITTAFVHEVIVLCVHTGGFWHQGAVTSISDTAGLFWQRRNQRQVIQNHLNGTTDSWVEEWWAHKPTTGATVITVNTAPTGAIAIEAVSIAGANFTTPFDTHTGAGLIVDNYSGNVIDPAGRGHFGNPASLVYTDVAKVFTLAFHASPDIQADTSVPAGWTFVDRTEHDEGSGNTLYLASMYRLNPAQQFGTEDAWFGPDGTHISNRYLVVDNIVASGQPGTADVVRWYFDGTGQRTIVQFGTGQTSTAMNVVTFRENTIMVVAVMGLTGANSRVDHISDDGHHSGWTRRSIVTDSSGAVCMEVWWVEMATAFSGNITITMDSQIQNGDFISAVAFAIHGADLFQRGEIWDGNGSLPATRHGTTGHQTVGPFSSSNDNVLVLAFGANIDTTTNDVDPTGKNVLPFLQLPAPGELVSNGPPSFNIALDYKFNGPVVDNATAEIDISPSAQSWLMIADAIAVGPVSPPHGSWLSQEARDRTQHNGDFTAIGIASPGGWVGFPPNSAALAAVEAKDKTTNSGAFTAIWDSNGWIGYIPAFMALAVAERDDTYRNAGWILGNRTILGRMHAVEDPDRLGFSNRGPAVTATMHPTERKDNFSATMLTIPTATPIPARKRRLLIVT